MSSFGGESPVGFATVRDIVQGYNIVRYQVPSGRYAKVYINFMGASYNNSSNQASITVTPYYARGTRVATLPDLHDGFVILDSGDQITTTNSFPSGQSVGLGFDIVIIEFNKP